MLLLDGILDGLSDGLSVCGQFSVCCKFAGLIFSRAYCALALALVLVQLDPISKYLEKFISRGGNKTLNIPCVIPWASRPLNNIHSPTKSICKNEHIHIGST